MRAISKQPQHSRPGCRRQGKMPCFPQSLPSRSLRELSYLEGSCLQPNLSQHRHQNWHQHGETWDSLVAALRETKISTRAGIRGHYGRVTFLDGMTIQQSNLEPSTAVRLDRQGR